MQGERTPDISSLRRRLRELLAELAELLPALLGRRPMFKGLYESARRCGKPSCPCAHDDGAKHPVAYLTQQQGKRRKTVTLDQDQQRRLAALAAEHRRFRDARARWLKLTKESQVLIRELEAARLVPLEEALDQESDR